MQSQPQRQILRITLNQRGSVVLVCLFDMSFVTENFLRAEGTLKTHIYFLFVIHIQTTHPLLTPSLPIHLNSSDPLVITEGVVSAWTVGATGLEPKLSFDQKP